MERYATVRRGHGLQPHPSRRAPRRRALRQGPDRHNPAQTHPCPGPHRHQRPENPPSPARSLALANSMAGPLRPPLPAATTGLNQHQPATRRNHDHQWNTQRQRGRHPCMPSARKTADTGFRSSAQAARWIKAKARRRRLITATSPGPAPPPSNPVNTDHPQILSVGYFQFFTSYPSMAGAPDRLVTEIQGAMADSCVHREGSPGLQALLPVQISSATRLDHA